MTKKEYSELTKQISPKTKSYKTIPSAFLIGGLICVIGELLIELYSYYGLPSASLLASISLIGLSVLATGFGFYDNIAKLGGAGTLVPITGFANAISSAAIEFKNEGLILGLGAKIFIIAGPVIVYGTLASCVYGLVLYIMSLF